MTVLPEPSDWYRDQVVFLTGSTGNIGGCLLYKLAFKLPTRKIYVLCRGSMRDAMEKWEASMPEQIDDILDTGKVQCLTGDITKPNLGLSPNEVNTLQEEVTVFMHSAGNLSFFQNLVDSVQVNCLPVMDLVRLAGSLRNLKAFLYISSISSKSFLQGGAVFEDADKVSPDEDSPESQVKEILATGYSPYAERFFAPYAQAKYLAEQLLLSLEPTFPVLIVRPTNIGPALQEPYMCYGPEGAVPLHTFFQLLVEGGKHRISSKMDLPLNVVVDEVPVDIVANVCLLHLAVGSTGIVQASAQLYVPLTLGDFIGQVQRYAPPELLEKAGRVRVERNVDFGNQAIDMLLDLNRDWKIDCTRTVCLKDSVGPIGLTLTDHDHDLFTRRRVGKQVQTFNSLIESLSQDQSL